MKRISSKRSELSKNIRASLGINPPSSPAVEDNVHSRRNVSPPQPFQTPPRRQSSMSDAASDFEFANSGPLPPLPFQQLGRKPSFMVVTPAHLRRPGPYSPGLSMPMQFGEDQPPPRRLSHSSGLSHSSDHSHGSVEGGGNNPKAAARRENGRRPSRLDHPEITVAVRVRPPAVAPARGAAARATTSDPDRPCLLVERRDTAVDAVGREAVSTRQQQALALLEKLEKKGGENGGGSGGDGSVSEETDGWPRLLVTVPQHVQGAISMTATTRKFSGFDHVFDGDASQEDVYNGVVDRLLAENGSGDNDLTLIACGHAKSGKSHTLFGTIYDAAPSAGQRRPPPVPVKRANTRSSTRHAEIENLQPSDGLLQRTVARLMASVTGPVSMSCAQLMATTDLPRPMQSNAAGTSAGSEHITDLLTGEKKYETESENFWAFLAKAPVSSLQDVDGRLRDGRRFWGHEGHVIVSFEFADRGGSARRLVLVDAAIADAQPAAAPHAGVPPQRLTSATGAIALDKLFTDARFVTKHMVLIATVSQEADDAAETMATLVSAAEVLAGEKANRGRRRRKSAARDREGGGGATSRGTRRSSGDDAAAPAAAAAASARPASRARRQPSSGSFDHVAGAVVPDLQPLLREEREANMVLARDLDELADRLARAQRELARARLRERELMLDVSATHGSLMALAQERDFEQAALLEATAAAAESQQKCASQVAERERLRRVIAGITGSHGRVVAPDGGLSKRTTGGAGSGVEESVADALAAFASGHAEAHTAAEKLRQEVEEKDRQLEKVGRMLLRERRMREKLKKLQLGDAAAVVPGDSDDDDDAQSPSEQDVNDELAAGFGRPDRTPSGRSPLSAPKVRPSSTPQAVVPKASVGGGSAPSPALDITLGSSLLQMLDSRWTHGIADLDVLDSRWTGGIAGLDVVRARGKSDDADEAAEWEVVEYRQGQQQDNAAAANALNGGGADLPPAREDLPSTEMENESEWEAMIAQFELDERRSTPTIRHRIHTASFVDSPC